MTFKERVKIECRKQGMLQNTLAERLGMQASNLNNQMAREETIQLGLVKKICKTLDISIGSLLSGTVETEFNKESQMIFKQLQLVLEEGERDTADVIVGKITREYLRILEKKDASRSQVANGK